MGQLRDPLRLTRSGLGPIVRTLMAWIEARRDMTTQGELPIEERVLQLLQHLGIQQAHFAASTPEDWQGLVAAHPEVISSLTLVCPRAIDSSILRNLAPRLLVFNGDQGDSAERLQRSMVSLPDAMLVALHDYLCSNAADVIADRRDSIGPALMEFLGRMNQGQKASPKPFSEGEGEVAGIVYRIQGSGPPLLLLPIEYAPSQWAPLLPQFAQHYSTISLGGAWLGAVANLEARAQGGYLEVVKKVVNETRLQPGERVLDVGCGSGVLDRWLAHRTGDANAITGVDISTHLIREAAALARSESLEGIIEFREGSAEALPFPDNSFDISMSFTVIHFVDAGQMLGEMMRVTKPGGRVAVLTHGYDRPYMINLPLQAELKAKAEAPPRGASDPRACADSSLYQRFHQAGLSQVQMFPQLATATDSARLGLLQGLFLPKFTPAETEEWLAAVAEAEAEGTFFIAEPYHCAVGTKP